MSLRDQEVAYSASGRQGPNFESCVWRAVSSPSWPKTPFISFHYLHIMYLDLIPEKMRRRTNAVLMLGRRHGRRANALLLHLLFAWLYAVLYGLASQRCANNNTPYCCTNGVLMLGQHSRRWPNINTPSVHKW